jgi:type VI protein secretion system component Hcp
MKMRCIVTLCLIITFAFSHTAFAENEAFLCIPNIPGGTADTRNPDCIDISSLSVDFSKDAAYELATSGGTTSSKPRISPFSMVKSFDTATVLLNAALIKEDVLDDVFIRVFEKCDQCDPPDNPFLVYRLNKVVVTRHTISYFNGGAAISEIVDLSFGEYSVCAVHGDSEAECFGWNLYTNTVQ